eukprot:scaffold9553_cov114-Isochrysis_galbana.AAC.16
MMRMWCEQLLSYGYGYGYGSGSQRRRIAGGMTHGERIGGEKRHTEKREEGARRGEGAATACFPASLITQCYSAHSVATQTRRGPEKRPARSKAAAPKPKRTP